MVWLAAGRPQPVPLLIALAGFVVALLGIRRLWPEDGSVPSWLGGVLVGVGVGLYLWAGQLRDGAASGFFIFMVIIAATTQARRRHERLVARPT